MEENKKAVENENKKISEEKLEEVAGGDDTIHGKCYFQPEKPFVSYKADGTYWVKCKSKCFPFGTCRCHGQANCKDRYHKMEQSPVNPRRWFPTDYRHYNHDEPDKTVEPLDP